MAATSSLGKAYEHLRDQLADSTTFRSWVGAGNQAEALSHIHYEAIELPDRGAEVYSADELAVIWPYAIISLPPGGYRVASTSVDGSSDNGHFSLQLVDVVDSDDADDPALVTIAFVDAWVGIAQDLMDLRGTAGYLDMSEITNGSPILRSHPDDAQGIGDEIAIDLTIPW